MTTMLNWLVTRTNSDGSTESLPLREAVSVLAGLVSAETHESRLSIAHTLITGNVITANGCSYQLAPRRSERTAHRRSHGPRSERKKSKGGNGATK